MRLQLWRLVVLQTELKQLSSQSTITETPENKHHQSEENWPIGLTLMDERGNATVKGIKSVMK